jgi:glycosyltransferase involved in cell wall biosynthesis
VKVSVVVTAYNLESFIAEAVDSALNQTAAPFEVIVVNDCSADQTASVLRGYGDRIRYIELTQNVGGLRAALTGLEAARGDIIAALDGDDVWAPTKLEKCLRLYQSDDEMILVSHQHRRVDRHRQPLDVYDETHRNVDRILRDYRTVEERSDQFKQSILQKLGFWLGSAYTFRRDALDLVDFKAWVDRLPMPQYVYLDLTIAPYLVLTNPTKKVGLIDERLFEYRIHGDNSCNDYRNVERALRAVHRGYYTTSAANELNHRFRHLPMTRDAIAAHERALEYLNFLESLYSNQRARALRTFFDLAKVRHFSPRSFFKESVRLGIVSLGGVEMFLALKNRH